MPEPTTTTLALAVWPPAPNRRGSYLAASAGRHRIAPGLAARAILAYSDPGDLVVDPHCGIGTVLVEAIQQGRRAIGLEPDRQRAALAAANISHIRQQGAPGRAAVLEGDLDQLPRQLAKAGAILNPPPGRGQERVRRHPAGSAHLILTAASRVPSAELLTTWAGVLAPGGFLLLVHTQTPDAPQHTLGASVTAAEQAGLDYWQHVIALRTIRTAPDALLHTDVLSFRKPRPDGAMACRDKRATRTVAA